MNQAESYRDNWLGVTHPTSPCTYCGWKKSPTTTCIKPCKWWDKLPTINWWTPDFWAINKISTKYLFKNFQKNAGPSCYCNCKISEPSTVCAAEFFVEKNATGGPSPRSSVTVEAEVLASDSTDTGRSHRISKRNVDPGSGTNIYKELLREVKG